MYSTIEQNRRCGFLALVAAGGLLMATSAAASAYQYPATDYSAKPVNIFELPIDLDIDDQIKIPAYEHVDSKFGLETNFSRIRPDSRLATTTTVDSTGVIHAVRSIVVPN